MIVIYDDCLRYRVHSTVPGTGYSSIIHNHILLQNYLQYFLNFLFFIFHKEISFSNKPC